MSTEVNRSSFSWWKFGTVFGIYVGVQCVNHGGMTGVLMLRQGFGKSHKLVFKLLLAGSPLIL